MDLLERVLVVEDDERLRRMLCAHLRACAGETRGCAGVAACLSELKCYQPTLVLLDFQLPDGTALEVLRRHREVMSWPKIIAISGAAEAPDAFELAALGVHAYLPKPVSPEALDEAIERAKAQTRDLKPLVRDVVGTASVHEVQQLVRETMVSEAIGRARGNRRAAARLLRISRQLLQHMLRVHSAPGSAAQEPHVP